MLKLKSLLVAVSVSPFFFIPFQLPSQSQTPISNIINSKNPPGTASGAGTIGSGGTNISNPRRPPIITILTPSASNIVVGTGGVITATLPAQTALNNAAGQITTGLISGDPAQQAVGGILMSSAIMMDTDFLAAGSFAMLSVDVSNLAAGGTLKPFTFRGGTMVLSRSVKGASITVTTAAGKTTSVDLPAGLAAVFAASEAVSLVLLGGGNSAQALMAGALAGTGGNKVAAIELVIALSGIFSSSIVSLPGTVPTASLPNASTLVATLNLNSVFVQPLDLEKQILVAQSSGTKVDVNKLNQAILAYNKLIDTSSPQAVLALSKNPEFIAIGQTLRKLRAALVR